MLIPLKISQDSRLVITELYIPNNCSKRSQGNFRGFITTYVLQIKSQVYLGKTLKIILERIPKDLKKSLKKIIRSIDSDLIVDHFQDFFFSQDYLAFEIIMTEKIYITIYLVILALFEFATEMDCCDEKKIGIVKLEFFKMTNFIEKSY